MDEDTITISGNAYDTTTFDYSNMSTASFNSYSYGSTIPSNVTISSGGSGASGSFLTSGLNGTSWSTLSSTGPSNPSSLSVKGDAEFEGDVKIKGVNIATILEDIQSRLAILVPDPAKLEHFAALKKAYEHYKMLEALCEIPKKENEE
jgi:hypothetical protein